MESNEEWTQDNGLDRLVNKATASPEKCWVGTDLKGSTTHQHILHSPSHYVTGMLYNLTVQEAQLQTMTKAFCY
jgi:hypothetical protein